MTVEERFERIERNLDILTKIHLDYHREHEERISALEKISGIFGTRPRKCALPRGKCARRTTRWPSTR
jgi:hypothetical protein